MNQLTKKRPAVKGLTWHRNQFYSFFLPNDWHHFSWPEGQAGVLYGPDAHDPHTVFAVSITDLGTVVSGEDLEIVAEGFFESVSQLPSCTVEERSQKISGSQIKLEAKYTFHDNDSTCKRWVRVYYHETRQLVFAAQGATVEKYEYWLPWFFEAMMTAKVHNRVPETPR